MSWTVPGDVHRRTYATREAAVARAWELTPAGGQRKEPVNDDVLLIAGENSDYLVMTEPQYETLIHGYDEKIGTHQDVIDRKIRAALSDAAFNGDMDLVEESMRIDFHARPEAGKVGITGQAQAARIPEWRLVLRKGAGAPIHDYMGVGVSALFSAPREWLDSQEAAWIKRVLTGRFITHAAGTGRWISIGSFTVEEVPEMRAASGPYRYTFRATSRYSR